ncbi:hypothetical protein [Palleronia abyssalis]|uniref:hypothetical protein n=1 Tax=Palleronia abyssalis TaxID=1501240 RepID=UPI000D55DECC|nr:hypothetical protein [Palleronia abyssalis]
MTAISETRPTLPSPSVAIAGIGAGLYAVFLFLSVRMELPAFGHDFYDQVWLALREGRLDLPARVVRLEGHYTPDGTAHFYHGLAPLMTRALLAPVMAIGQVSLAPFSIWLWAVIGSTLYHAAFLQVVPLAVPRARAIVSLLTWFGGPGILLAGSHAFYHEPIGQAYALGGGFVLIWARAVRAGRMSGAALMGLAALAAACVHARPSLAVAFYAGVVLAAGWALRAGGSRRLAPPLVAISILGVGGGGYLALNEARFGAVSATHGSFEKSDIQYGTVFWGLEDEDDLRPRAFIDHGRLHAGRIVPNALVYAALPPAQMIDANISAQLLHASYTLPRTGFTRIEAPVAGLLFLWTGWIVAASAGIAGLRHAAPGQRMLAGATGIGAILILAYATITLRYLLDLWPFLAALALIGLPRLVCRIGTMSRRRAMVLAVATGIGMGLNLQAATDYRQMFREDPASAFAAWDAASCRARARTASLPASRIGEICRDPRVGT